MHEAQNQIMFRLQNCEIQPLGALSTAVAHGNSCKKFGGRSFAAKAPTFLDCVEMFSRSVIVSRYTYPCQFHESWDIPVTRGGPVHAFPTEV